MADPDPEVNNAAMKARIIKHLNADHQISLSYYLRHYKKLSSREATSPTISDISFETMSIQTVDGKTHTVPFKPPMKSWAEARQRTVDMDRESREALDISSIRITEFKGPGSIFLVTAFYGMLAALKVYLTKDNIVPGTFVDDKVVPSFPGGLSGLLRVPNIIFYGIMGIHAVESYFFDKKLQRYGVERGSALWWKWIANIYVEGVGCTRLFDAIVARKKREAEKAQH